MTRIRPATEADVDRIVALNTQGFNPPSSWPERLRREMNLAHWRVADDGGSITGITRAFPFAHFYGGRAIPATGIASVVVSPEARGRGVGFALMRETLAEKKAEGSLISSLYPATVPLYRSVGYGFGGIRTSWKSPLGKLPAEKGLDVEAFDGSAVPEINDVYESIARRSNGLIRRDPEWWDKRVLRHDEGTQYRYLVREDGRITGWAIYSASSGKDDWRFRLSCRDFHWVTPRAARALLSFAAFHRSTANRLDWPGPPMEPIGNLTGEDVPEIDFNFRWMLRLLDVPGAIEARGYNPHVGAGVTIGVSDPLFQDNEGTWRIEIVDGMAKVSRGGTAEATADVATWASLWSSLLHPGDAVRTGELDATPAAQDALELIFAGPTPWLADFY